MICDRVARIAAVCFWTFGIGVEVGFSGGALGELDLLRADGDGAFFLGGGGGVGAVDGVFDAVEGDGATPGSTAVCGAWKKGVSMERL